VSEHIGHSENHAGGPESRNALWPIKCWSGGISHEPDMRETTATDRREKLRFPIKLDLRFRSDGKGQQFKRGTGFTINMSSSGILFRTDNELNVGHPIQLLINWPELARKNPPLKLIVSGTIVRTAGRDAAMTIETYGLRHNGPDRPDTDALEPRTENGYARRAGALRA